MLSSFALVPHPLLSEFFLHSILLVFSDVTDFNPYTFSAIFFCSLATATFLLLLLICLPVSHSYLLSLFVFEVPIVINVSAMSRFGRLPQRLSTSIYIDVCFPCRLQQKTRFLKSFLLRPEYLGAHYFVS